MARPTSRHSARDELKRIFERALSREPGIGPDAAERAVRRLMRRTRRIAELGSELGTPRKAPSYRPAAAPAPAFTTPLPRETAPPSDFDPFSLGAVVTLARFGRGGLMERLAAIDNVEHLRKLAAAQHLGVEGAVADIGELREAIVTGAERRMAERRAAAS
jgi:hypothetical protein